MSADVAHETRPLYWSIRRELWENRSLYVVPLLVAGVVVFAFFISAFGMPQRRRAVLQLDEAKQRAAIDVPYEASAGILFLTSSVVAALYCLDALYGERRDRSILFWKSMPVSDRTTVLSKAAIPLVIMPVLTLLITIITHIVIFMLSTMILLAGGLSLGTIVPQMRFVLSPFVVLYALVVFALWHAPIYAWLLAVSAWAKRATFVWSVLPFFAIMIFETIAFRTSHFARFIGHRLSGCLQLAFAKTMPGHVPVLTPETFLGTPGLWLGLVFAAAFLFAAMRLRRYREPL